MSEFELLHTFVPFRYPSVVGAAEDALFLLNGSSPNGVLVEFATWPPRITTFAGEYVLDAARERSGVWLCQACTGNDMPRTWRLAYVTPDATQLADDEPLPFELPDMTELLAHKDKTDRSIESAHTHTIEEIVPFEGSFMLVPRHAGIGVRKWPFVYANGAWKEERGLPPYVTAVEEPKKPIVKSVRLGDGADVLLWGGAIFERSGGALARTFEQHIEGPSYNEWELVPAGSDGFFWLSNDGLREVHRGANEPKAHLEELSVNRLARGPNGMLLVGTYEDLFFYDPKKRTIARLTNAIGLEDAEHFCWTQSGLVALRRSGAIELLRAADALSIRHVPLDDAMKDLVKPPDDPAPTMTDTFATSRPRAAAFGDRLAIVTEYQLRVHTVDAPLWRIVAPAAIVGVVALPDAFAILDADGKVHVHAASDGAARFTQKVAPNPRSIAASRNGDIAVLASGGVWLVRQHEAQRVAFEAPIAAAFDAHGTLMVAGEHGRIALVDANAANASLRPIAAPADDVRAVAALANGTWLALAGRSLLRFDPNVAEWKELAGEHLGAHLAVSADGKRIAVERGERLIHVAEPDAYNANTISTSYGESYSEPADEKISVTGLAFLDDGRVVAGLDEGRANILLQEGALKLDPFEGDAPSRWIFIHQGQILIAS